MQRILSPKANPHTIQTVEFICIPIDIYIYIYIYSVYITQLESQDDRIKRRPTKMNNNSNNSSGEEGFHGCYLLTSLSPRHKGHTYIGYTVNPRRRIRQHNGEIGSGAVRTKRKRPWVMLLCIYGFPSNVSALQFEWAWQHPTESIAVRTAAASFKSLRGLANKIKLAFTMLSLSKWHDLDLTVNFFSSKYSKYLAGCPTLPEQMSVQICSMDDLPFYTGIYITNEDENRNEFDAGDLIDDTDIIDTYTNKRLTDTTVENGPYICKKSSEGNINYRGIKINNRYEDGYDEEGINCSLYNSIEDCDRFSSNKD